MRTRILRLLTPAVTGWLALILVLGAQPVAAQSDDLEAAVERMVIDLVRAEQNGDMDRLYDYMAPESRNMVPRQAFITWWLDRDAPLPSGAPTIESVDVRDGVYALTGTEYDEMARVEFTVPVEGSDEPEIREMTLAHDGVTWRWFLEASEREAEDIAEGVEFTVDYDSIYTSDLYRYLDTFWAQIFADNGADYRAPVDMVGVREFPVETACGVMDEETFVMTGPFYCGWDETIYYAPVFREWFVDEFGTYAWDFVVAHEWAHHVQNVLGLFTSHDPELYGGSYTIEHELQADCLAGVFTQDAYARGVIKGPDVFSAEDATAFVGDQKGTRWDERGAHGTSAQRVESFWLGFDDGLRGCYISIGES